MLDANVLILNYWKLIKKLKSVMTEFAKDIFAIFAVNIEVECLFSII